MKLIQQIKRSQLHKKVSDDVSIFVDENRIFVFENFCFSHLKFLKSTKLI